MEASCDIYRCKGGLCPRWWSQRHSSYVVHGCCLWTHWAAAVLFKLHQLKLRNLIKALSWCAKGQLGEVLHFFGSDSRNSSSGARRIPFTWDTLFKSSTSDCSKQHSKRYSLQQTLRVSRQTWINCFISATNKIQDRAGAVCVFFCKP